MQRLVFISDTHGQEHKVKLPKGDILIHCGDLEIRNEGDLNDIISWFESLDYENIIWTAGNHDFHMQDLFKNKMTPVMPPNVHYLLNSSVEVNNIKFFGSPFTPFFNNWAFNSSSEELKEIWDTIPSDIDIVITHCPPYNINDQVNPSGLHHGCPMLRNKLKEIKPKYHVCGHLHESAGVYCDENTTYINCSVLDEFYALTNKPVEIEYE